MSGLTLITDIADGVIGDVKITDGDLTITNERDSIVLRISQKLQFFFAEWFLDKTLGIPYFERILVRNPDPALVDSILKQVVLSVDGITRINQWIIEVDRTSREMRLTFRADSIYGEIDFSDNLGKS